MEKRKTIFDFLGSVFMIYGITITMLLIMIILQEIGDVSSNVSTMFSLGSRGLTSILLVQLLFISFVIIGLQYLFFSEQVFKNMSKNCRTIIMFGSVLVVMSVSILVFGWFPKGDVILWAMFAGMYLLSVVISIVVNSVKERLENKQMAEGLSRYKAQLKKEKDNV